VLTQTTFSRVPRLVLKPCLSPRRGRQNVATGGAQRNPWKPSSQKPFHEPRASASGVDADDIPPGATVCTQAMPKPPQGAAECSHGWSAAQPVETVFTKALLEPRASASGVDANDIPPGATGCTQPVPEPPPGAAECSHRWSAAQPVETVVAKTHPRAASVSERSSAATMSGVPRPLPYGRGSLRRRCASVVRKRAGMGEGKSKARWGVLAGYAPSQRQDRWRPGAFFDTIHQP
jgi:hypothetical protein